MLEHIVGDVAALCEEGIYATTGQVFAWEGDDAVDGVISGEAPTSFTGQSDVMEVFCLTKPIVAVATVLAAGDHNIDVHSPLHTVLESAAALDDQVSVASIINHSTSLQWPSALEFMLQPLAERTSVSDLRSNQGDQSCYSEIAGWLILTTLIETLTGKSCSEYVRDRVTRPLGIAEEVVLDGQRLPELVAEHRVVAPLAGLPAEPIPLLHIFAPAYWARLHPALGGLASARAIGVFTSSLIDCLAGEAVRGLPHPTTIRSIYEAGGVPRHDTTWRRRCAFALGFELTSAWSCDGERRRLLQLTSHLSTAMAVVDAEANQRFALLLDGSSTGSDDLAFCRDAGLASLGYYRHDR